MVGGGLLWASIEMNQSRNPQITITESAKTQEISDDDMFGDQETKPAEIDEMFKDVD